MSAPAHPDSTDLDRLHSAVKREKEDLAPESQPAPMWDRVLLMLVAIIAAASLARWPAAGASNVSNPFLCGQHWRRIDPRPGGGVLARRSIPSLLR
jgi:hypothetical protein